MITRNFTLREETVDIFSLSKHFLVDSMGYLRPDDLYISGLAELGPTKRPIITEDMKYVTSPDLIDALKELGVKEVDVLVLDGANQNDLLKIINFESRPMYRGSKSLLYKTIKTLQHHLWNTDEGKEWYKQIHGDDINEKIGTLVGYKKSTISRIKSIGDNDFTYLEQVDDVDTEMTLRRAEEILDGERRLNERNDNYSGRLDSNGNAVKPTDDESREQDAKEPKPDVEQNNKKSAHKPKPATKPLFNINLHGFNVDLGSYGCYALDCSSGNTIMKCNDRFAGIVNVSPQKSNNPDEGVKFIIQEANNAGWSFQVVARGISKLLKEQEVES